MQKNSYKYIQRTLLTDFIKMLKSKELKFKKSSKSKIQLTANNIATNLQYKGTIMLKKVFNFTCKSLLNNAYMKVIQFKLKIKLISK